MSSDPFAGAGDAAFGGAGGSAFDSGMDDFEVDFSGAGGTEMPEEGVALIQLLDIKKGTSKAGNPQWISDWRILEYREPARLREVDAPATYRNLPYFTATTRAALWKVEEMLDALGVPPAPTEEKEINGKKTIVRGTRGFKRSEILGTVVLASIKLGEYQGKPQANIDALAPHPDGAGTKADLPQANDDDIPF